MNSKQKLLKLLELIEVEGKCLLLKEFSQNIMMEGFKSYRIGTTEIIVADRKNKKKFKKQSEKLMKEVIEFSQKDYDDNINYLRELREKEIEEEIKYENSLSKKPSRRKKRKR